MHPKEKGELTEQIVITELMKKGCIISVPVGDNQEYDCIIDINKKLLKCQIRTANLKKGKIICRLRSVRINSKGYYVKRVGNIDLFLFYCYETNEIYAIEADISNTAEVNLRVIESKQIKNIRPAEDYILDKYLLTTSKRRS